jgi:hypothetical protein
MFWTVNILEPEDQMRMQMRGGCSDQQYWARATDEIRMELTWYQVNPIRFNRCIL